MFPASENVKFCTKKREDPTIELALIDVWERELHLHQQAAQGSLTVTQHNIQDPSVKHTGEVGILIKDYYYYYNQTLTYKGLRNY